MRIEKLILNEERNVTLTAYIQEVEGEFSPISKRPGILVLPGGGYAMCSDREADPVATAFLRAGYQAFILRYSTGDHREWPNPLEDYEQAMTLIRKTEEYKVDPDRVAVIGFSAGGHLAACAATIAKNKPNAALLGYAAINKEICDFCQPGMPYPAEHVDAETAPCFLFATRDDYVVNIDNTLNFEKALVKAGVTFESHIYSCGNHGFSTAERYMRQQVWGATPRMNHWVDEAVSWLGEVMGEFTARGFEEPICDRIVNPDAAKRLSAGCSLGYLRNFNDPVVQKQMKPYISLVDQYIAATYAGKEKAATSAIDDYRTDLLLTLLQVPDEKVQELNRVLKQVENKKR